MRNLVLEPNGMLNHTDTHALQQRNRELSILNTIARALNTTVDLDQALQTTLQETTALFGLHSSWVWLLHEETGEPYLAAALDLPSGLVEQPELMEGTCYCLDWFSDGDMASAANINVITCSRLKKLIHRAEDVRYHASVPLYAHEKPLGVLNVASADWQKLSAADLRLLYTIGDLLGIAVERARLFARSTRLGAVEERNRLAREIHDTLAQGLTGIALQLESADALLEGDPNVDRARLALERALALTRSTLEEARRSVLDLRAAPLEGRTLAQALAWHADQQALQQGASICFTATGSNTPLPLRVEVGLYRIAQEALANALRHSAANQISITVTTTPTNVQLLIEDNGQGFDPTAIHATHYGLVGMNERVHLLGGSLTISSAPDAGTRLEVRVPLGAARGQGDKVTG